MIGRVSGVVAGLRRGTILIDCNGLGYSVHVPATILQAASPGEKLTLLTHLAVRENALDLYGFRTEEELSLFELFLSVSGVGPKTALAVVNLADVETLKAAIGSGEAVYLTKVAGIGRKTAERLIVELKDKIGGGKESATKEDVDVLEALRSLGYQAGEARDALKNIPRDTKGVQSKLREALKVLTSRG